MTRLVLAASLLLVAPARAGFEVGNGGDAVTCDASGILPAGTYALDFLMSSAAAAPQGLAPASDLASSVARIERLLQAKLPSLAADFSEFATNFLNTGDWNRRHVWEPVAGKLRDLKDEGDLQSLPTACVSEKGARLRQAVIRARSNISGAIPGQRVYAFDPRVLEDMRVTSPLQLSFLLVHEWLWEYSHVVARNRRVAAYLHSEVFDSVSSAEATSTLLGMGFPVPDAPIAEALGMPCDDAPVSTNAIHARYARHFGRAKLGSVRFDVAIRDICPDSLPTCNRGWRPFRVILPEVLSDGLQAHVWYQLSDAFTPVKIINPSSIRAGTFPLPSTRSPLSCTTGTIDDRQAQCALDSALAAPLLRHAFDPITKVVLRGTVAENCMNVHTSFASPYGSFIDDTGASHDVVRETRLTVSGTLSWPD